MIARILRILAARRLGKHGSYLRTKRNRDFIRSTARQMRKDMGLPPLKALGG